MYFARQASATQSCFMRQASSEQVAPRTPYVICEWASLLEKVATFYL